MTSPVSGNDEAAELARRVLTDCFARVVKQGRTLQDRIPRYVGLSDEDLFQHRANTDEKVAVELSKALLAALERERVRNEIVFTKLVELYPGSYVVIARLCDEALDRTGALLGRVREACLRPASTQTEATHVSDGGSAI